MSLHVFTCIYSLTQPENYLIHLIHCPIRVSPYPFSSMANPLTAALVCLCGTEEVFRCVNMLKYFHIQGLHEECLFRLSILNRDKIFTVLAKSKARTHSACVSLTANRWFPHEDVKVKKKSAKDAEGSRSQNSGEGGAGACIT